jgi:transposase-like protein
MSMSNTEKTVKDIRRNTRRECSTEEKIRIVLDGLRGESSIAELYLRNDWLKKSLTGQGVTLDDD